MGDLIVRNASGMLAPGKDTKAIDMRRSMVSMPSVRAALSDVDMSVLEASTKMQIADIPDAELVKNVKQMLKFIAIDVGYSPKDVQEWAYQQTRILSVMKRYYSNMTLADIRMAFELSVVGELDEYLPKDSTGAADRKHYQQFNVDYFSKIVNAYKKKHDVVVTKAYNALPAAKAELSDAAVAKYNAEISAICRMALLRYKYKGDADFGIFGDRYMYEFFNSRGFADDIRITDKDRSRAVFVFLERAASRNKYDVLQVRRDGADSPQIDFTSYEIARHREIIRAFDRIIRDELDINNIFE